MREHAIRDAIDNVVKFISANPEKARVKNAAATAALKSDLSFAINGPNGEAAVTDMPKGIGGGGGVPQPGWLLRAALASCTGTVIAMRAAKLGITLDRLEVNVDSQSDNRGLLGLDDNVSAALIGLRTVVRVRASNAADADLQALVQWADAHSPVACTLRNALAANIETVIE
ncbi:MAG TPA: OsmC family protein [Pseudolabrys sp.]|nr:OsmC family protein [Pseudolabrys sp.]